MYRSHLPWQPIAILLVLSVLWGANMAIVKVALKDLAPLFMAAVRSLVASFCLYLWMRTKGIVLFPSKVIVLHGLVVGLLFGSEFALIYIGLNYTLVSRVYVLVYLAPFFVALEAHVLIRGDRLNRWKTVGLFLAFIGVVILFAGDFGTVTLKTLPGDLMILVASILWASTTVYLKKYLAHRTVPLQTLFYQVFFSAPLLFTLSIALEHPMIKGISWVSGFSLFFQCIIIAFLSYLAWFELVHRYSVTILHAFSFFTPVFGVIISGIFILHEPITATIVAALIFVTAGMVLVNYQPGRQSPERNTHSER
jgi:drug/metabolite transporter (DMT)-like permease